MWTRQYAWELKQEEQGRCTRCQRPRSPRSRNLCSVHLESARLVMRERVEWAAPSSEGECAVFYLVNLLISFVLGVLYSVGPQLFSKSATGAGAVVGWWSVFVDSMAASFGLICLGHLLWRRFA
jgi:hypothetical protein